MNVNIVAKIETGVYVEEMSQKKKLEKLTPEQERLMYEFRDNYINYVLQNNSDEKINFLDTYNKIKNNIWWRYEKAGLKNKKPLILIADSYLEEKLMINYVKMISEIGDQVKNQVWNQVKNQVWNQVKNQVENQVSDQVWNQVKNQVENQVWNQVKNQVKNQVENQVSDQVWNQVKNQVENQVENQVWNQVSDQVENQVWNQVKNQVRDQVWNQVKNQVENQVWNQVSDKVKNQVWNQVSDQVWNQVENQVKNQVSDQVWNQVRDQVRDQVSNQVKNQVWNQVKNQKLQFIEQYFGLGYEYWISFYEFFNKIGILKGKEKEKFNKYIQPYNDGKIWSAQFFENFVFICRLPKKINRDSSNRLHSINEAAVQWNGLDYFGKRDLYFIHGVFFEKNEWLKIVNNEISAKDLLKMENKEKQRAALSVYSMEKLIQELDAQEIDVYKNPRDGNEIVMYQIDSKKVDLEQDIKYLKYKDPSTDRVYISGIPPETNTAREGIAWKFGLSVEEYENDILNES